MIISYFIILSVHNFGRSIFLLTKMAQAMMNMENMDNTDKDYSLSDDIYELLSAKSGTVLQTPVPTKDTSVSTKEEVPTMKRQKKFRKAPGKL